MKKTAIIILLALAGISANLQNETKIGYVYMELVLNSMDETKQVQAELTTLSTEKKAMLLAKTEILNQKVQVFRTKDSKGNITEAERTDAKNEIDGMQKDLEELARKNERELGAKRVELLKPIAKKLEKAMDEVAAAQGYKYVLNSSDGTGNSIVIVAPEADDLTQEVMKHLGIAFK